MRVISTGFGSDESKSHRVWGDEIKLPLTKVMKVTPIWFGSDASKIQIGFEVQVDTN